MISTKNIDKSTVSSTVTPCERFNKHLRASQRSQGNILNRSTHRKIVLSKPISTTKEKSSSTGVINNEKQKVSSFKTTKSDCLMKASKLDFCKKCGDTEEQFNNANLPSITNNYSKKSKKNGLQQHYINKNFKSTESIPDSIPKKVSLDTINEQPEGVSSDDDKFRIYSTEFDDDSIKNIKDFRSTNFFECHSAKSLLNVTSEHDCIYRFYLNERLFPVPFNTDFNKNIRCMECNLPLQNRKDLYSNGMIQAKVNLNNQVQDTLLMLPVKEQLIIKERKKSSNKEMDSVFFGIIKLDLNGDSIFNRTLPDDSLALKYQKGYRQFRDVPSYHYSTNNDGIIMI